MSVFWVSNYNPRSICGQCQITQHKLKARALRKTAIIIREIDVGNPHIDRERLNILRTILVNTRVDNHRYVSKAVNCTGKSFL